ncbi:cupin domain-containing protein [Shewanella litorisediminis]|uniref:Cupin domain-containing protein n=1 Tax=Shewanella litorisediminis TaxID=1173586 RepID=A0ABX7G5H0_9GAMM|nr:cupin domain-containing protein [Shewanella litorisediminis]MCL2918005.1 cupin domain-containing protein [Shewanella litorisediminis]QRH02438.1 cupin domain-containing protein [Shewanella litorisediminis]
MANLLTELPENLCEEVFETLIRSPFCRIERIVSFGHSTAEGQWYDQDEDEWVVLLSGSAVLAYDDGSRLALAPGDYVNIPARVRHRVEATDPAIPSVWLAVFYGASAQVDG